MLTRDSEAESINRLNIRAVSEMGDGDGCGPKYQPRDPETSSYVVTAQHGRIEREMHFLRHC